MIRHLVFWRLNGDTPEARAAQARDIKRALEDLNGKIPGLIRLEVGIDFSAGPDSADVALVSDFESRAALDAYHHHPDHLAAAPVVKAARVERRVVDYEI